MVTAADHQLAAMITACGSTVVPDEIDSFDKFEVSEFTMRPAFG